MEITHPDQLERDKALDLTHSFIVQAPAGSGKTALLIQRYLALLAKVAMPEEILAVTFTRKAAQEMRHRVMYALSSAKQTSPSAPHQVVTWQLAKAVLAQDKQCQWQLLNNPHRLRILTIDALCAMLVRQAPFKSLISDAVEMIDDDILYVKSVHDLLEGLQENLSWTSPLKKILSHLDNNYRLVETLLVNLLKKRDQWLLHLPLGQADLPQLREILEKSLQDVLLENIKKLSVAIPFEQQNHLLALARFAAQHVEKNHAIYPFLTMRHFPDDHVSQIPYWRGLVQLLLTKERKLRKIVTVREGFPVGTGTEKPVFKMMKKNMLDMLLAFSEEASLEKQLAEFSMLPPPVYEEAQWEMLTQVLTVLPVLVAHLKLNFQQARKTDYVEMTLKALMALGDEAAPSDLMLNLDYKIQHILVDEFQDTAFTQFHLLEKLTLGWEKGDGRTLFLVGDPMQSIYRFRKAEVGLFIKAMTQGVGKIKLKSLKLSANFRSLPRVVSWSNEIFEKIFPKKNEMVTGDIVFSASVASKPPGESEVVYYYGQDEKGREEASLVCDIISRVLKKQPHQKIAILVRSRSHLLQIVPLLKEKNIAFNATEISAIMQNSVIQDLVMLTRALLYLTDRTAWLALLRAPWCGLCLPDLTCVAEAKTLIWDALLVFETLSLSESGKKNISHVMPVLMRALSMRQRCALSEWVEMTWRALGGEHCITSSDEQTYVTTFFSLLHEMDEGGDIVARDVFAAALEKIFVHAQGGKACSVELMTIHKAKGLEFDTVILPSLHATTVYDPHALLLWLERPKITGGEDLLIAPLKSVESASPDPVYQYLRYIDQQKAESELQRLLYVAVTRAKSNLFLTWTVKPTEEKAYLPAGGSFLALLWPHLDKTQLNKAPALSLSTIKKEKYYRRLPRLSEPLNYLSDRIVLEKTRDAPLLESRMIRNVGILLHRLLIQICQTSLPVWQQQQKEDQENHWKMVLQGLGTPHALLSKGVDLVERVLHQTLQDVRGKPLLSVYTHSKTNYPVTLFKNKRMQHVVIDRWFVDEAGQHWLVLFKMGEVPLDLSGYFKSLFSCARVLFPTVLQSVMLGVYFPFVSRFFYKAIHPQYQDLPLFNDSVEG